MMHVPRDSRLKIHAVLVGSMACASILLGLVLFLNDTANHPGFGYAFANGLDKPRSSSLPTCNQPSNQTVLLGQSGVKIDWTIKNRDRASGYYIVFHDTVPQPSSSLLSSAKTWLNNTPFSVPVTTTIAGWHNYTLFFTDLTLIELSNTSNIPAHSNYSTTWVHVETPPAIHAPAELRFHVGTPGQSLDITITDPDSASGWINVTRNGTMVRGPNLLWNDSQVISIPLATTIAALFDFAITVTDHNYTVQQHSTVWIAYNFPPEILGLHNCTVSPDAMITTITFRITDIENSTGNYTVLRGGNPFNNSYVSDTWTNNSQRVLYIGLNTIGLADYQVIAEDLTNNKTTSTFFIEVNDPPRIKSSTPQNRTTPNQNVTWIIIDSDNATGNYTVFRNSTILPGFIDLHWTNDTLISVLVDTSAPGFWNYSIVFTDGLSTRQQNIIILITENNRVPLDPTMVTILLGLFVIIDFAGMGIILGIKKK